MRTYTILHNMVVIHSLQIYRSIRPVKRPLPRTKAMPNKYCLNIHIKRCERTVQTFGIQFKCYAIPLELQERLQIVKHFSRLLIVIFFCCWLALR